MALQIVDASSTWDRDSFAVLPNKVFEPVAFRAPLNGTFARPQTVERTRFTASRRELAACGGRTRG